jgi:peroxiredoxin
MGHFFIPALITAIAAAVGCAWLCWQLLRQNGRMLLRLEELEKRLDQLEAGEPQEGAGLPLGSPAPTNQEERERANRFRNRSLARSKIKRDGLKAGTTAPDFRLPRLDGRGELSLAELRGRRVVIIFSSPRCAPCDQLAPKLERFHLDQPELDLVMISQGEPGENRAKVKEHGLTFLVVLQPGWAISRLYATFATPAAYLLDPNGAIAHDVAIGAEPILNLLASMDLSRSRHSSRFIS